MTHSYESWVSHIWSDLDKRLVLSVMIGFGILRIWLLRVSWWISHYYSLGVMSNVTQSMSCVTQSMSHSWGKNPYIIVPFGYEFWFSWTISPLALAIEISTPWEIIFNIHHTCIVSKLPFHTLNKLHPPPLCPDSLIMILGLHDPCF